MGSTSNQTHPGEPTTSSESDVVVVASEDAADKKVVKTINEADALKTLSSRTSLSTAVGLDGMRQQQTPSLYGYGRRGTSSERFGDRDSFSSLGSLGSVSRNGSVGPSALALASLAVREELAKELEAEDEANMCPAVGLDHHTDAAWDLAANLGGRVGRRRSRRGSMSGRMGSLGASSLVAASALVREEVSDIEDGE